MENTNFGGGKEKCGKGDKACELYEVIQLEELPTDFDHVRF